MLPINVDFGAAVTPELLAENRASWNKSCLMKFSKSKLERAAKKRKRDDSQDETPIRVKRQHLSKDVCLFCGHSGDLHEVMTLEVDEKVRQMATDLHDSA